VIDEIAPSARPWPARNHCRRGGVQLRNGHGPWQRAGQLDPYRRSADLIGVFSRHPGDLRRRAGAGQARRRCSSERRPHFRWGEMRSTQAAGWFHVDVSRHRRCSPARPARASPRFVSWMADGRVRLEHPLPPAGGLRPHGRHDCRSERTPALAPPALPDSGPQRRPIDCRAGLAGAIWLGSYPPAGLRL